MKTLDLRKKYEKLYKQRRGTVSPVNVPALPFLMVGGSGGPNDNPSFHEAIQLLYTFAYTLKFTFKKSTKPIDFPIMPLEGLWWMADGGQFRSDAPDQWRWRLMIMMPGVVRAAHLRKAAAKIREEKQLPVERLRLERFREGPSVQALHIGPYSEEAKTLGMMAEFMREKGFTYGGHHHEIYFSDPRRTPPEKFRTILRHPVKKT